MSDVYWVGKRHLWVVEALVRGNWRRVEGDVEDTKWRAEIGLRDWKKVYPKTQFRVIKYLPLRW